MQVTQAPAKAQESVQAARGLNPGQVIAVLSTCMALQMTSYSMTLPLFARRFSEFGAGVEALGASDMAFALTSTLAAPLMGALADRFGRRPLVLVPLAAYGVAYLGFLLAPSAGMLIVLRGLAGAFTAGLMPAVIGLASDLAPEGRRAQWLGFVSGGAALGWIGPLVGGLVFDRRGYRAALMAAILLAVTTFVIAFLAVPEGRRASGRALPASQGGEALHQRKNILDQLAGLRSTLPAALPAFFILLFTCFAVLFAWAFIGPVFMFYAYDELGWSSSMLGLAMSTYAIAMTLGEFTLGRLSDRWGRKPVILTGLVLFSAQFIGLAFTRSYLLLVTAFIVAGLGNALYDPAINASILDISPQEHQARILGIRYMAGSFGNILGPGLVVLVTGWLSPGSIFLAASGVVLLAIVAEMMMTTPGRRGLNVKPAIEA